MSGGGSGDAALGHLAEEAGLAAHWRDAFGQEHDVGADTLRRVLAALGLPAGGDAEIAESRAALRRQKAALPPLVTALVGQPAHLPHSAARFRLDFEDGGSLEGVAEEDGAGCRLPAIDRPGYHRLTLGGDETALAVSPGRCFTLGDAAPGRKLWGFSAQLYGLRRPGDGGIGDFAALRDLVRAAAARGAAAVAISPVHAQFSADPDRFGPYAPSSRVALNALHADADAFVSDPPTEEEKRLEALSLIDWPHAARARLARLRRAWDIAAMQSAVLEQLREFRTARGDEVERHARFEALHAHFYGADPKLWSWRNWPDAYRDPASPAVEVFARQHGDEVSFHVFLQFLAEHGMRDAQRAAREAGMPVGLIADLAVGTDGGGSHGWSRQEETLLGLTVGAPPDLLSKEGQNWGITAFSPRGLRLHGYRGLREMLGAALRHAGGVRIDHAMGLARLWVVPEGASSRDGVYLRFPLDDMLRLVALESHRHRAVVLGEDLGTLPEGFQPRLEAAGVLGMRVLWFEREGERFTPPRTWSRVAAAMTSTHDLATVAGWWGGTDLRWRGKLDLLRDEAEEWRTREADRGALWQAFCDSGSASGDKPPAEDCWPVADAAAAHIGRSACELALLPLEDALAEAEQPNLPGTLHEHPNWQRRQPAPAAELFERPDVAARIAALDAARRDA